jgi:hypothetical protein
MTRPASMDSSVRVFGTRVARPGVGHDGQAAGQLARPGAAHLAGELLARATAGAQEQQDVRLTAQLRAGERHPAGVMAGEARDRGARLGPIRTCGRRGALCRCAVT